MWQPLRTYTVGCLGAGEQRFSRGFELQVELEGGGDWLSSVRAGVDPGCSYLYGKHGQDAFKPLSHEFRNCVLKTALADGSLILCRRGD